jgi:peptide/nickel transport system substrate-binding protein
MARRRIAPLPLLAVALLLVACSNPLQSGKTPTPRPVEGGTLVIGIQRAPQGIFNPLVSRDDGDERVNRLLFSGLLRLEPGSMAPVCDLCRSITYGPDGKSVTFQLREDVRWHDGAPFTAADVAFTFRSMLHPEYPGVRLPGLSALVGVQALLDQRDELAGQVLAGKITRAEAAARQGAAWEAWLAGPGQQAIQMPDPHTVRFQTDVVYAPLIAQFTVPVLPAHLLGTVPPSAWAKHETARRPVGTGPYQLAAQENGAVRLTRHERYHHGRPHITTVIFRVMPAAEAVAALKAGDVHVMELDPGGAGALAGESGIRLVQRPVPGYQYMGLNHDRPLFADRRVRQALMYGIDRQGMVDRLLGGYGTVVQTHLPPGHWALDGAQLNPYPHDPAKAAALLAEAGWSERNPEGYLTRDGQVFAFTLSYPGGNPVREASAAQIQSDLKRLGIKVTLSRQDFAQLHRAVFGLRSADAWLLGWDLGPDPDPGPVYLTDNKWGRASGWSHPRSEELVRLGTRLLPAAERRPLYAEWAQILNAEVPALFLYAQNEVVAIRTDRVRGLPAEAAGDLWQIWQWWLAAN